MGNSHSGNHQELSESNLKLCRDIFFEIDKDHQNGIDINEAKEWWKSNFAVINSKAMFEAVDLNHDGVIDIKEWVSFWTMVKHRGHSDEEIEEELLSIQGKLSWASMDGLPHMSSKENIENS